MIASLRWNTRAPQISLPADSLLRDTVIDPLVELKQYASEVVAICKDMTRVITPNIISVIWSATTESRALRRFVVNYYGERVQTDNMVPTVNDIIPDFKNDLILALMRSARHFSGGCLPGLDKCRYHEHHKHHPSCLPELDLVED
ncbi:hypothetical protein E2P81_ATG10231 [Venturia nashicola]|nr:hypothetical protein E2P81_ATG10231 [Venturia nashicola]